MAAAWRSVDRALLWFRRDLRDFDALARENSDDPGSAAQGGKYTGLVLDVGWRSTRLLTLDDDETSGEVASYADRFEQIVGKNVGRFLGSASETSKKSRS